MATVVRVSYPAILLQWRHPAGLPRPGLRAVLAMTGPAVTLNDPLAVIAPGGMLVGEAA